MASMKFKDLLRNYRESKGLSKTDLAKKIRVSLPYIIALEAGRQKAPSLDFVVRISRALDLTEHDSACLARVSVLERMAPNDRAVIEGMLNSSSQKISNSREIVDALTDPIAVKALLVTHKSSVEIKENIKEMLECLPDLAPAKRYAIIALCK